MPDENGPDGGSILVNAKPVGRDGQTCKRVLAIADETTATVIDLDTGEILSERHIDPARGYGETNSNRPDDGPRNDRCLATYETYISRHRS